MSDIKHKATRGKSAANFEALTFTLGADEFGIDLQCVKELRGYAAVSAVADTPAFVKGIATLDGKAIPVLDLRIRLNLGQPVYDQFTVLIIVNLGGNTTGLVVDRIADVVAVQAGQIKPVTPLGARIALDYLLGVCVLKERSLILMDVGKFLLSCDPDMLGRLRGDTMRS